MCWKCAINMPTMCCRYAGDMTHIAGNMPTMCCRYAGDMTHIAGSCVTRSHQISSAYSAQRIYLHKRSFNWQCWRGKLIVTPWEWQHQNYSSDITKESNFGVVSIIYMQRCDGRIRQTQGLSPSINLYTALILFTIKQAKMRITIHHFPHPSS